MNLIDIAIPFFLISIGIEAFASYRKGLSLYRVNDTVGNLANGIGQQFVALAVKGSLVALYAYVYSEFRMVSWEPSWALWVGGFLAVDFVYYWFHRSSHRINMIWTAHIVHHQSEDYNLGVALRQSGLQLFFSFPFYLLLAVAGIPFEVFLTCYSLNLIYQFWIHTQLIDQMGPLEWVMNTPSHHRVHHGINPQYLDKNYAGVLIIWDRFFGTFQPEEKPVVYGITKPLRSFNPIWAWTHYWVELFGVARRTAQLKDKIQIWFRPPDWLPEDCGGIQTVPDTSPDTFVKFDPELSLEQKWFYGIGFLVVNALAVVALQFQNFLDSWLVTVLCLITTIGLIVIGMGLSKERETCYF